MKNFIRKPFLSFGWFVVVMLCVNLMLTLLTACILTYFGADAWIVVISIWILTTILTILMKSAKKRGKKDSSNKMLILDGPGTRLVKYINEDGATTYEVYKNF